MDVWRNRQEERLADLVLVHSRFSARQFVAHGWPAEALAVVPPRVHGIAAPSARAARSATFLFLGTDPFRKGIGVLLQAWDALRPRGAELRCLVDTEVLRSERVLRFLVRNPNVAVRPLVAHAQLAREYDEADCQILPSLEEGLRGRRRRRDGAGPAGHRLRRDRRGGGAHRQAGRIRRGNRIVRGPPRRHRGSVRRSCGPRASWATRRSRLHGAVPGRASSTKWATSSLGFSQGGVMRSVLIAARSCFEWDLAAYVADALTTME
jgi:hypothetical protein